MEILGLFNRQNSLLYINTKAEIIKLSKYYVKKVFFKYTTNCILLNLLLLGEFLVLSIFVILKF